MDPVPLPEDSLAATFWDRLHRPEDPDECWFFVGWLDKDGYGVLMHQGFHLRAHRAAWALTNGPIPQGLAVLHSCRRPPCCNPRHLRVGTQAENVADSIADGTHVSVAPPRPAPGQFELDLWAGVSP